MRCITREINGAWDFKCENTKFLVPLRESTLYFLCAKREIKKNIFVKKKQDSYIQDWLFDFMNWQVENLVDNSLKYSNTYVAKWSLILAIFPSCSNLRKQKWTKYCKNQLFLNFAWFLLAKVEFFSNTIKMTADFVVFGQFDQKNKIGMNRT